MDTNSDHVGSSPLTAESHAEAERTYPYEAWVLLPSFKPACVTIVERYRYGGEWEKSEKGKVYSVVRDLFPTKKAAIEAGWVRVDAQEAKLFKMQAALYKKREALAKATA